MTSKEDFEQATKLCNSITGTSVDTLKKYAHLVNDMEELRDAAEALAKHLDDAIVKSSPCKYNVSTVENSIDGFRHYKFKKFSGLCGHNLSPILQTQVDEALRAEKGMLAIRMLIPILDFFNQWSGTLDDSYGEGGMFVADWNKRLEKAISLIIPDKLNNEDHAVIEEIMTSMENLEDYGWEGEVDESGGILQEILDGNYARIVFKRARQY
mmetsp:Transcript_23406/g.33421  ORF Transcript_23406/g.33421 Transcript_23406/m.33421 type:complete len:211 (-) Transcript_23406:40-672(-)|eukprot:CAMPEP_0201689266 /NCGR_PEP_ID=MMETSP0578-20130828/2879_1 /ASSEMBLY_ACC=CAM_ASM_000663 /TAXON_ID=267565 /ORGANISM="Skeletonema grethea, Strain CCMP 1804" /LENGTH=210 /DNA_ID=CAMNT_0048173849 /DNA_START=26 /DNA_END=658 /DNA_ORIENTATION=+